MIQDKAMMVRLTISQWTGRKQDKKVTDEVEKAHGAKNAGRFNKDLVDKALLEPISKLAGAARDYHYHVTLAWSDNGDRVLPSALFLNYTQTMRKFKSDFESAVQNMLAKYPNEVQAARQRLGTMYEPDDYPAASHLAGKFSITTEFNPIPSANDFRVEVDTEARQAIQADIEGKVVERQAQAVKSTLTRVKEVVDKMHEKLVDPKAIFRDSLVTNVSDLREILVGLNITNNGLINELAVDLKDLEEPPEALRSNGILRQRVADRALAILNKLP